MQHVFLTFHLHVSAGDIKPAALPIMEAIRSIYVEWDRNSVNMDLISDNYYVIDGVIYQYKIVSSIQFVP